MAWTAGYAFSEPMQDVRGELVADRLVAELRRELGPGHAMFGRTWMAVARALPEDEVLFTDGEEVAMVHLAWTSRVERPPWPQAILLADAVAFEQYVERRWLPYD